MMAALCAICACGAVACDTGNAAFARLM
jgi:hypothetical protein